MFSLKIPGKTALTPGALLVEPFFLINLYFCHFFSLFCQQKIQVFILLFSLSYYFYHYSNRNVHSQHKKV